MGKTVYAVSQGEYSDYTVLCVCSTEDVAQQIVAAIKADGDRWDTPRFEVLPLFNEMPTRVPYIRMSEILWDDGKTQDARDKVSEEWPWGWNAPYPRAAWRWVRAPIHGGRGGRLEVRGTDIARCRKVFRDKRREIRSVDALRTQQEAKGGS